MKEKINKDNIIKDLKAIFLMMSKIPSKKQYKILGSYSVVTVCRKFGSWSNALQETFSIAIKPRNKRKLINCAECGKETFNPKFCCGSCSAKANNRSRSKNIKQCKVCKEFNTNYENLVCQDCKNKGFKSSTYVIGYQTTIQDLIDQGYHKTKIFTLIRAHAKSVATKCNMTSCSICKYNAHVEISHKKAISSFDPLTKISEINSPDNLWSLCANHHSEYDRGFINIPEIQTGDYFI